MTAALSLDPVERSLIAATVNLSALRRTDPSITSILQSASHVVLYEFSDLPSPSPWRTLDVEGALFLVARTPQSAASPHRLLVVNRKSPANYTDDIHPGHDNIELNDQMIMYRNAEGKTIGIWFFDKTEAAPVHDVLCKLLKGEKLGPTEPVENNDGKPQDTSLQRFFPNLKIGVAAPNAEAAPHLPMETDLIRAAEDKSPATLAGTLSHTPATTFEPTAEIDAAIVSAGENAASEHVLNELINAANVAVATSQPPSVAPVAENVDRAPVPAQAQAQAPPVAAAPQQGKAKQSRARRDGKKQGRPLNKQQNKQVGKQTSKEHLKQVGGNIGQKTGRGVQAQKRPNASQQVQQQGQPQPQPQPQPQRQGKGPLSGNAQRAATQSAGGEQVKSMEKTGVVEKVPVSNLAKRSPEEVTKVEEKRGEAGGEGERSGKKGGAEQTGTTVIAKKERESSPKTSMDVGVAKTEVARRKRESSHGTGVSRAESGAGNGQQERKDRGGVGVRKGESAGDTGSPERAKDGSGGVRFGDMGMNGGLGMMGGGANVGMGVPVGMTGAMGMVGGGGGGNLGHFGSGGMHPQVAMMMNPHYQMYLQQQQQQQQQQQYVAKMQQMQREMERQHLEQRHQLAQLERSRQAGHGGADESSGERARDLMRMLKVGEGPKKKGAQTDAGRVAAAVRKAGEAGDVANGSGALARDEFRAVLQRLLTDRKLFDKVYGYYVESGA